jgi:multiple sugar transport system permease protein
MRWGTHARIIGVLIALGLAVFPLYWMFVTSLTSDQDLFGASPTFLPDLSRLDTYSGALSGAVPRWLLNSFVIAAGTCALTLLLAIPGLNRRTQCRAR